MLQKKSYSEYLPNIHLSINTNIQLEGLDVECPINKINLKNFLKWLIRTYNVGTIRKMSKT